MKNFAIANVIDTERTCWAGGVAPEGQVSEIIEIGLCEVNLADLTLGRCLSLPVVPIRSTVSPYCTELTGWTDELLRKRGRKFEEVCRTLAKYGVRNRLIIADSADELECFAAQCAERGIENPFGVEIYNVSTEFTLITGQKRNLSLEEKLAHVKLPFDGKLHRASEDARNIARLFAAMMSQSRLAATNAFRN